MRCIYVAILVVSVPFLAHAQQPRFHIVSTENAERAWDPALKSKASGSRGATKSKILAPYNVRAQKRQLRREGVLKVYDKSKKISAKSKTPRTEVLRNLITSVSEKEIKSSLSSIVGLSQEIESGSPDVEKLKTFKTNVRRAFQNTRVSGTRVWEGAPVQTPDPYLDTVMIIGNGELCSGTLISPYQVITAAHCFCDGVTQEVSFGQSFTRIVKRVEIDTSRSKPKIACSLLDSKERFADTINAGDIALYWLKEPISNIATRKIASEGELRLAHTVRAVGFGETENGSAGTKFDVDIVIASYDCADLKQGPYRCAAHSELIAAGMNRDTCDGDSGGPIYIPGEDGHWHLAGLTSRSVDPKGGCGNGGIYVKLTTDSIKRWLLANGVSTKVFSP